MNIDLIFNDRKFFRRHGFGMRDIKTQPFTRNQGAFLGDMITQLVPQRSMQQMGCRMVRPQRRTAVMVNFQLHVITNFKAAAEKCAKMNMKIAKFLLGFSDSDSSAAFFSDYAGIAFLATRLAIKRRLVKHQSNLHPILGVFDNLAINNHDSDLAFGAFNFIAEEFRRAILLANIKPDLFCCRITGARPGGSCIGALLFHRCVKTAKIDAEPLPA